MDLIGLPGRNPETEAWMTDLTGRLCLGQTRTRIAHYRHWDQDGDPDVAFEAGRLHCAADDLVVAKSLGTLVLLACSETGAPPGRAVFIGAPLAHYPESSARLLKAFAARTPSLFIQQTADFNGAYADVAALVGDAAAAALAEVAGGDHVYSDTAELAAIIDRWWQTLD